jgi:hypothetical protein
MDCGNGNGSQRAKSKGKVCDEWLQMGAASWVGIA